MAEGEVLPPKKKNGKYSNQDALSQLQRMLAIEKEMEEDQFMTAGEVSRRTGIPKATVWRLQGMIQTRHSGIDPDILVKMRTKHRNKVDQQIEESERVIAEAIERTREVERGGKPDYVGVAMLLKSLTGLYDHKTRFDGLNAPKMVAFVDRMEEFIQGQAMTVEEAEEYRRIAMAEARALVGA